MEGPFEMPNRNQDFRFSRSSDSEDLDRIDLEELNTEENNNLDTVGVLANHETEPNKVETKEAIEQAQEARADLMLRVLLKRLEQVISAPALVKCLNHLPVLGDIKMVSGAVFGKEGKHKLTAGERLNYIMAASTGVLVLYFLLDGNYSSAAVGECVSGVLTKLDHAPVLMKSLSNALADKTPKTAHLIETMSDFVFSKREALANILGQMLKNPNSILNS